MAAGVPLLGAAGPAAHDADGGPLEAGHLGRRDAAPVGGAEGGARRVLPLLCRFPRGQPHDKRGGQKSRVPSHQG
eukprot:5241061-Pyramimonas_sp.AAC.1